MNMWSGVATFAILFCALLASLATPCSGAFINPSSGNNKGDRNEIQSGYNIRQPDLPALYSAPKSHQEQDAQDNEVDEQSSTDRDATTTEVYFEDREEDTSEDYPYTTLATQSPRDMPAAEYGVPVQDKSYPTSQDNPGGYSGFGDSRKQQNYQNNNNKQLENSRNQQQPKRPLDQQQIENHHFPQHTQISPPSMNYHDQSMQLHEQRVSSPQYGPPAHPMSLPDPRMTEQIQGAQTQFDPQNKNTYENQYSQNNELQRNAFQPAQYLPPQSPTYTSPARSYEQPAQTSYNEPQRFPQIARENPMPREYNSPRESYDSQSIPSHQAQQQSHQQQNQQQQQQQYFPQGEHTGQQNNNYDRQPNPTGNYRTEQTQFPQQLQPTQQYFIQGIQRQPEVQNEGRKPQLEQNQYLPPRNDFRQDPNQSHQNYQGVAEPKNGGPNGIPPSGNDIFEFDGFHDNDNVVDAELLQRVQQIIEEHERQQKEIQEKLRRANEANEAFFHNNNHIGQEKFNNINEPSEGAHTGNSNQGFGPSPTYNPGGLNNDQGFYLRPSVAGNNSIGMHNEDERQRSLQPFPSAQNFGEPQQRGDNGGEAKNYLNSPYGVPDIQIESEPFRQEQHNTFPQNQNRNLQVYSSPLSPTEQSRHQFQPESQNQYHQQQQQQIYPDLANGISNERQYGSPSAQSHNEPENQVNWPHPLFSNAPTTNGPQSTPDPKESGQRSNENPSTIKESSSGKPHIEYQKAILTDHFVETQPEFPSRARGDDSRRGEYTPSSVPLSYGENLSENPTFNSNNPAVQGRTLYPAQQLTSTGGNGNAEHSEASQFNNQQPNAPGIYNRGNEQVQNENRGINSYQNDLHNRPIGYNLQQNQHPENAQTSNQIGNPNIFYGVQNAQSQGRAIHPTNNNESTAQIGNQYGIPYSQPISINYNENLANEADAQRKPAADFDPSLSPKHDQPQHTSQHQGFYPTSYTSNGNTRTIVVHEVPYGSVQGVSNRVLIHPTELSPSSNPGNNEYNNYEQAVSSPPDNSFNANQEQNRNMYSNNNVQPSVYGAPQQQQHHFQDTNQHQTLPYQESQIAADSPQTSDAQRYIQPTADAPSSNSGYLAGTLGANEILSPSPKPIYGIPLAPVVDPDSFPAPIDQRDSSVVLSSQISFGEIGSLSQSDMRANPNDNLNVVQYYVPVNSHQQQQPQVQYFPQSYPANTQQQLNDLNNNQIQPGQFQPEIIPAFNQLGRQGSWNQDGSGAGGEINNAVLTQAYGLPQSGSEPSSMYGVSNHTSVPANTFYNSGPTLSSIPLVGNSISSSQNGYFYPRRNRSLKKNFDSPVKSPLVTSFTVKSTDSKE